MDLFKWMKLVIMLVFLVVLCFMCIYVVEFGLLFIWMMVRLGVNLGTWFWMFLILLVILFLNCWVYVLLFNIWLVMIFYLICKVVFVSLFGFIILIEWYRYRCIVNEFIYNKKLRVMESAYIMNEWLIIVRKR